MHVETFSKKLASESSDVSLNNEFRPFPAAVHNDQILSAAPLEKHTTETNIVAQDSQEIQGSPEQRLMEQLENFKDKLEPKEARDKLLLEKILSNPNVKVELGENIDMNNINIDNDYIPETRSFRVFRF